MKNSFNICNYLRSMLNNINIIIDQLLSLEAMLTQSYETMLLQHDDNVVYISSHD